MSATRREVGTCSRAISRSVESGEAPQRHYRPALSTTSTGRQTISPTIAFVQKVRMEAIDQILSGLSAVGPMRRPIEASLVVYGRGVPIAIKASPRCCPGCGRGAVNYCLHYASISEVTQKAGNAPPCPNNRIVWQKCTDKKGDALVAKLLQDEEPELNKVQVRLPDDPKEKPTL